MSVRNNAKLADLVLEGMCIPPVVQQVVGGGEVLVHLTLLVAAAVKGVFNSIMRSYHSDKLNENTTLLNAFVLANRQDVKENKERFKEITNNIQEYSEKVTNDDECVRVAKQRAVRAIIGIAIGILHALVIAGTAYASVMFARKLKLYKNPKLTADQDDATQNLNQTSNNLSNTQMTNSQRLAQQLQSQFHHKQNTQNCGSSNGSSQNTLNQTVNNTQPGNNNASNNSSNSSSNSNKHSGGFSSLAQQLQARMNGQNSTNTSATNQPDPNLPDPNMVNPPPSDPLDPNAPPPPPPPPPPGAPPPPPPPASSSTTLNIQQQIEANKNKKGNQAAGQGQNTQQTKTQPASKAPAANKENLAEMAKQKALEMQAKKAAAKK